MKAFEQSCKSRRDGPGWRLPDRILALSWLQREPARPAYGLVRVTPSRSFARPWRTALAGPFLRICRSCLVAEQRDEFGLARVTRRIKRLEGSFCLVVAEDEVRSTIDGRSQPARTMTGHGVPRSVASRVKCVATFFKPYKELAILAGDRSCRRRLNSQILPVGVVRIESNHSVVGGAAMRPPRACRRCPASGRCRISLLVSNLLS